MGKHWEGLWWHRYTFEGRYMRCLICGRVISYDYGHSRPKPLIHNGRKP